MGVTILVAFDDNRVIGNKQKIPWHLAEDLQLFKKRTLGHKILMGRKTWESLPLKPLPGRLNIVLTRKPSTEIGSIETGDGPVIAHDIISICREAKTKGEDLFIVGGSQIYELALKLGLVDSVIVSKIPGKHEGDAHFPVLPEDRWACQHLEKHDGFEVLQYTKKRE